MAIAFVQHPTGGGSVNSFTAAKTFSSTTTAGNLLLGALSMNTGSQPITSVTDGTNTWSQAVAKAGTGIYCELWYVSNAAAISTVTANLTGNTGEANIEIYEYSGIVTSSALDKTATNSGSGTAIDTGTTATTSQNDELVFAIGGAANGVGNTMTGYSNTSFDAWNVINIATGAKIVSTTGTQTASWTNTSSQQWTAAVATFKGVASASTHHLLTLGAG